MDVPSKRHCLVLSDFIPRPSLLVELRVHCGSVRIAQGREARTSVGIFPFLFRASHTSRGRDAPVPSPWISKFSGLSRPRACTYSSNRSNPDSHGRALHFFSLPFRLASTSLPGPRSRSLRRVVCQGRSCDWWRAERASVTRGAEPSALGASRRSLARTSETPSAAPLVCS